MGVSLPARLTCPTIVDGMVASKVLLDLTIYLAGPSEPELDFLLELYKQLCPPDRLEMYTVAELEDWWPIARPLLTASGRAAAAARAKWPYLEPARKRIREGRGFEVGLWDGREIDDADGGWSFSCRRILLKRSGLHAFVRFLMPLNTDPRILRGAAASIADNIELLSGHGGPCFVYDPRLREGAFDAIYALSRRYWGVDVESLNGTLPLSASGIKGVNWITMVGDAWASEPKVAAGIAGLRGVPGVSLERKRHGVVLTAGLAPVAGDQNHPDSSLDPYFAIGRALAPLHLSKHPDFPGEGFIRNKNTVGWIRRFVAPAGWR